MVFTYDNHVRLVEMVTRMVGKLRKPREDMQAELELRYNV